MRDPKENNSPEPSHPVLRFSREFLLSFRDSTPSLQVMNQMINNLQGSELMNATPAKTGNKLKGG